MPHRLLLNRLLAPALLAAFLAPATAAAAGALPPQLDADTRQWWALTTDLSSDAMEGRDTGSPGHARAVDYVIERFKAAGLQPAGTDGRWTQTLPLHEVRVEVEGTRFAVLRDGTPAQALRFLHEITVRAEATLPAALDAPLVFRGYCGRSDVSENVRGKVVVCFGGRRQGVPGAGERVAAATAAGAVGVLSVDDPGFTIEPSRWPDAYARTVRTRDPQAPAAKATPAAPPAAAVMRLASAAFAMLLQGSGRDADALLAAGSASQPLPSFDLPARLQAAFKLTQSDYTSDNVLGLLPGTDPKLKDEVVVLSAHLDGYGYGEPVEGDRLYNGAFDDAAYVATLIRHAQQRQGRGLARSVLYAAFTGEEKGLLGATWFTRHPTVPRERLAANINLDQLRPLFPLETLTMLVVDDSTLTDIVRPIADRMKITIRADLEPERNLVQRADHYPFLKIGVPATGFIFGYEPGSEAERRFREWYRVRYHRPQDDIGQPIDFQAAADLNRFLYRLLEATANAPVRPTLRAGSPYLLKP